jgi:hypothetical protein
LRGDPRTDHSSDKKGGADQLGDGAMSQSRSDCLADAYGLPATQAPVFSTDSLYINGVDSPISLPSANVDRKFRSTILRSPA